MTRPRRKNRGVALLAVALFGVVFLLFQPKGRSAPKNDDAADVPAAQGKNAPPRAAASSSASPAGSSSAAPPGDSPPDEGSATDLPTGKGLPVLVSVGVHYLAISAFDDTKGEFECTTDLRLRWEDPRLRFPAKETFRGFHEYRGKDADAQLGKMWSPTIETTNRVEDATIVGRRIRIFPDGRVESMLRTRARYKTRVDPSRYPFDRQHLAIDLLVREDTTDHVLLRFGDDDIDFSHVSRKASLDGWKLGLVDLKDDVVPGWNGDRYGRVVASLTVDRVATSSLAPIFIPLIASLLIPLLALWMNGATEEGYEVEAFELANMGIGGLFSVIALSFAIYSSYGILAGNDNTVTRLFALNYAMLALALGVVVFFYRFDVPGRLFGMYVRKEAFNFLLWATPVLTLATSVAFLVAAAVLAQGHWQVLQTQES